MTTDTTPEEDSYLKDTADSLAKQLFPFAGYHPMVDGKDPRAILIHERLREVWDAARI